MQRNQNDGFYGVLLIPIKHYTTPVESGDLLCTIDSLDTQIEGNSLFPQF
jgi:hypothetical protein